MMTIAGYFLGGIGLFFVGLQLLSIALKQLTSRQFRNILAKWAGSPFKSACIGLATGIFTQSTSALSFITASMAGAGMITVRQGIPMLAWANPALGVLIFVAFLDIKPVVLIILGISGLFFSFLKPSKLHELCKAFLGLSLLIYGLNMIHQGSVPLGQTEWFKTFLLYGNQSYFLCFFATIILTLILQSSTAVSILAISFYLSDLLSIDQTILIIYTANVGISIITGLLSLKLKGTPKQLVIFQALFNVITFLILLPLFIIETAYNIPIIKGFSQYLFKDPSQQMACVYVIFNLTGAIISTIFLNPMCGFLNTFWPASEEEEWCKLKYIHDHFILEPETTADLLVKEQTLLIQHMTEYINTLRNLNIASQKSSIEARHNAFAMVTKEIHGIITGLLKKEKSLPCSEQIATIQNREYLLISLEQTLYDFSTLLAGCANNQSTDAYRSMFVESLDTILLTASETCKTNDSRELDTLILMTSDRSELMRNYRCQFLTQRGLSNDSQMALLELTALFERAVWILGKIALLQRQSLHYSK